MNNPLIQWITTHLGRTATVVLALLAALFVLWGLLAQTPTPSPTPQPQKGKCQAWAEALTDPQKITIKKAFVQAINKAAEKSTEGNDVRTKLLDKGTCYESPKTEINKWIKNLDTNPNLQLPPDAMVVFYDPDAETTQSPSPEPTVVHGRFHHYNQCWHIFWLTQVGSAPLPASNPTQIQNSFMQQFKCCYQPW
jgi:hypothetical protein